MKYVPPKVIANWENDIPNGELYSVTIFSNKTISSSCGRYAHSSGSKTVSWNEFIEGEMNKLVESTMGGKVLREIIEQLKRQIEP